LEIINDFNEVSISNIRRGYIMVDNDLTNNLTIRDVLKELEKTRIPLLSTVNKIRAGTAEGKLKFVNKCECLVDVYTALKPTNHKDLKVQENAIECLKITIDSVKIDNPELFP
jgi:hypothetical protein